MDKLAYRSKLAVNNNTLQELVLWIEPWAKEFQLAPQDTIEVEFDAQAAGQVEMTYADGAVVLHGFPGSSAVARRSGSEIWISHQRLPS